MAELMDFDPDLLGDNGLDSITLNDKNERDTAEKLAVKCEQMQNDEERKLFFGLIDKNSVEVVELHCPAILVLVQNAQTKEFKQELETFIVENLIHEKSRLIRKTCSYALKTNFLPLNDTTVQEYFVLLGTLEEPQFHVVEPSLEKMSILADRIHKSVSILSWTHLRVCFIRALRHVNGWIRSNTILRILKLPIELLVDDYEFAIDIFLESLRQYDIYWRVDQIAGINSFLADLRNFFGQFENREFYTQFLTNLSTRIVPSPMFFISCCLPVNKSKMLDENDLPIARRLFLTIDRIQYQKLRHNIYLNFFTFYVQIFKLDDVSEFDSLFNALPEKIKPLANQILMKEFGKAIEYANNDNVSSLNVKDYTVDDLPLLFESILTESDSMLVSMSALISLIPKVDDNQKIEIMNAIETAYFDARKSAMSLTLCVYYVDALLLTLNLSSSENLERLFKLLESQAADKNPQIGFIIARQINKCPNISLDIYPLLLELAIYGEIPQKNDEVLILAHQKARSLQLDELTDLDLLRGQTRELVIIKLLNLCTENKDSIDGLILLILQKHEQINKTFKNRSFGLSKWHRYQTRLMSLLLIFIGNNELFGHLSIKINERVRDFCIDRLLDLNQQYSLKLVYEWILTLYCIRDNDFYKFWLQQATTLATTRIGSVSSWIATILRTLRTNTKLTRQRLNAFLIKLLPWTTSQHFVVHVQSLSAIKMLCTWHRQTINDDPSMSFALEVADFDIDVVGNTRKLMYAMCSEPYFDQMFPEHIDLRLVFYGLPRMTGMPKEELIFQSKSNELLLSGLCDFIDFDYEKATLFSGVANNPPKPKTFNEERQKDENSDFEIQQKINTFEMKKQSTEQKQLFVVASFVNKPANLGGLSRTCEIFNVSGLTISNLDVLNLNEFKALSMASHKNLPIIEVRPGLVLDYLKECRSKGFAIVAAEQTSRSVPLEKFNFPEKSVLLLGDEKQGVPPELIRYVDHTVEISQLGLTRSLNVHVTASLFIYEYVRQHLLD